MVVLHSTASSCDYILQSAMDEIPQAYPVATREKVIPLPHLITPIGDLICIVPLQCSQGAVSSAVSSADAVTMQCSYIHTTAYRDREGVIS